jgi:hypothetical protein
MVLLATSNAWHVCVLQVADFGLSKQKQQTYVTGAFWDWVGRASHTSNCYLVAQ